MSIFVDDASLTIEINKKINTTSFCQRGCAFIIPCFFFFSITKINIFQEPDMIYWKLDTLHTAKIHNFGNMHIIVKPISSIVWKQVMLLGVTLIKIMLQSTT